MPHRQGISRASTSNLPTPLASVRISHRSEDQDWNKVDGMIIERLMDSFEHDARMDTRRRLVITELILVVFSMLLWEAWEETQDSTKRQDRTSAANMPMAPIAKAG